MPNSDLSSGRILSISSRGRITLDVDGCLVIGQLLDGAGGWIGERVEGGMRPGPQQWRHMGSTIISHVQVLMTECAAQPAPVEPMPATTARAA